MPDTESHEKGRFSPVNALIGLCLHNRLLVVMGLVMLVGWGVAVAPFNWDIDWLPRDPVPVDAIPDLGENQQIVFTQWPGRSPQDVEDQVTYPLTVALLGIPGVKDIRSQSVFGFSSVSVIFQEDIEFYWSRSRIVEKLNSLPPGTLPEGVAPALGPDATALGQVYWYTLEGRTPDGEPAGGWDPQELRSIQDWNVRYALASAEGVSEVASVGGFVQEYQVDVDPDAMRAAGVTLAEVFDAVRNANLDVGARTIEINRVAYTIRGKGFIESLDDLRESVVAMRDNIPIRIRDVAAVSRGPALRRGALDKEGAEAVGGVVVVRYGANPLEVIQHVKGKTEEIAPGLPMRAVVNEAKAGRQTIERFAEEEGFAAYTEGTLNQEVWLEWLRAHPQEEWPEWVTTSKVTIVPFYDRTGLILETLGTLETAITLQILVTIIVVVVMSRNLRVSLLISATLPLAVLIAFIAMKLGGVTANIVALSGIAIAIGTVVDMGVILCENVLRHLGETDENEPRIRVIYRASCEVGGAVTTAIATTVISFLPVFTMIGAEGKLFRPLAYTKTFALLASVFIALTILPTLASFLVGRRAKVKGGSVLVGSVMLAGSAAAAYYGYGLAAFVLAVVGLYQIGRPWLPERANRTVAFITNAMAAIAVTELLVQAWMPLGIQQRFVPNLIFVAVFLGGSLLLFQIFLWAYIPLLRFFLANKAVYLFFPAAIVFFGLLTWLGAGNLLGVLPEVVKETKTYTKLTEAFPGLGREFMPPLDEGSFLYMPTTMPHASIGEALDVLQKQDRAFAAIPEVEQVVGKIGRVESALDPAPVSMIETVIQYKSEFKTDADGGRVRFRYDYEKEEFACNESGALIPDPNGLPYRQWREHIRTPEDIWEEIVDAGEIPGTTSAPKLQPIMTRIVMLQSGMRAPMGVKVRGPDLHAIERAALDIEKLLREVPGVRPATVYADRVVGTPYIEIDIDRERIARYGVNIVDVQNVIEVALGGREITTTVEGRERYPVRVRYLRELRDDLDTMGRVLVAGTGGAQIPLIQLADIRYIKGPQMIKSEDTFLVAYVTFDKEEGYAEVDVVEAAQQHLAQARQEGRFAVPAGVNYAFAGTYENQVRAQKTLRIVLPLALLAIFVILYLQFRSILSSLIVFSAIGVAWGGGFILIWLYGQDWFLDFAVAEVSLRTVFQMEPIMLSVAIWVGFLALFGIASDDGVVMATYLDHSLREQRPSTREEIREAVVIAGRRRIRPCLMTSATTILALAPVLTSTGRGAGVMVPMAIPSFGGMIFALITLFLVPVFYSAKEEARLRMHRALEKEEKP